MSDIRDPTTVYYFNIGADISRQSAGMCGSDSRQPDLAMAYQVDNGQFCYPVSGSVADKTTYKGMNFSLYDDTRPARGVSITMVGGSGQWCYPGQTRTFTVSVQCAPIVLATVGTATVFERNKCDYQMELKSIAGCPTQCINNGLLCANNGVCGYDTDAKRSKCFCYSGFTGGDCSAPAGSAAAGLSGEAIILIVVCVVLSMVIGLVVFMFLKLRKLQVDPAAYDQLQGRFNELGMLSG